MLRTYKYRLYPSAEQTQPLDHLLWQGRTLYNAALAQRIARYRQTGLGASYGEQWAYFREQRTGFPELYGLLNASSVQQLLRRLDKSFKAFFRRVKAGEKPGFPRFKGRNRFDSLDYRHGDGCKLKESEGRSVFYLQNVGDLKLKLHRPLPMDAQLGHVTLKRRLGKWYVCVVVKHPAGPIAAHSGPAIGIDMGLKALLALSNGLLIENPRWLRGALARLRSAQRRLARRKKGSKRRRKAAFQVARHHQRVRNQRRDFWHKLTRQLADTYGVIALEKLTLAFMTHNRHLALSAHDAGLGLFQQLLGYKVEETGSQVVEVKPKYTSQVCSSCGVLVEKDLHVRMHTCVDCGLVLDRDINAARNILALALYSLGRGDQALTWPEGRASVA
jgi:putative transposase